MSIEALTRRAGAARGAGDRARIRGDRTLISLDVFLLDMPMRRSFTSRAHSWASTENLVVAVDVDGVAGAGESVPKPHLTGQPVAEAYRFLSRLDVGPIAEAVSARSFDEGVQAVEALQLGDPERRTHLAARCALELALLDALGKRFGHSLQELPGHLAPPMDEGGPPRAAHPLSATLDYGQSPEDAPPQVVRRLRHVKVKVGRERAEDVSRVAAVRRIVGADVTISLDANRAWGLEEAIAAAKELAAHGIGWIEEPLMEGPLERYRAFREATGICVLLDESLCSRGDAEAALASDACDLFSIRLSKCGGLIASLRLVEMARARGVGFEVGCHVGEMGVLGAAGRHLAAAAPAYAAFHASHAAHAFAESIIEDPLPIDTERMCAPTPRGPGLGVSLAREVVERHAQSWARWERGSWTQRSSKT